MSYKTAFRQLTNEYFHVYNRGVRKSRIFYSTRNYEYFMQKVPLAAEKFGVEVVCFCLMPTHFHFLLKQLEPDGVSKFMGQICNGYAKAINRQRGSTGHVFESKYKLRHVDTNEYLRWLSRYIHRNPIESSLVERCPEWKFSSYQDYLGLKRFGFVRSSEILSQYSSVAEYAQFVEGFSLDSPERISEEFARLERELADRHL